MFAPLEGPGWEPDPESKAYLHSGLQGSFADFPQPKKPFASPERTPLDHDPRVVVSFLETQIESNGRPFKPDLTEN